MRFQDKVVVVTGGTAGIGAACARAFASDGARVAVVARDQVGLDRILGELRALAPAIAVRADVGDPAQHPAIIDRTVGELGALHILVNNAGKNCRGPVEKYAPDELGAMVDVNLKAPIMLSRRALPHMRRAGGGAIVNVASLAGFVPLADEAVYSASKFGLRIFGLALAEELRDAGITVSAVSPGPVDTSFITADLDEVPDVVFSQPLSTPEEIAALVLACAADGRVERRKPHASGYLATLAYLMSPRLRQLIRPIMERQGRRNKARYRQRNGG